MSENTSKLQTGPNLKSWIAREIRSLPRSLFKIGVFYFVLGFVIDLIPGGEFYWFMIAAGLIAFGLWVPNRKYRIAATVLLIFSGFVAVDGYKRGVEYKKWMADHPLSERIKNLREQLKSSSH